MSHEGSPNTSEIERRLRFSRSPDGALPESPNVTNAYRSNRTDLQVLDYREAKGSAQHTFWFRESNAVTSLGVNASDNFEGFMESLENDGEDVLSDYGSGDGPFHRLTRKLEDDEVLNYSQDEYLEDLRKIRERDDIF